MALTKVNSLEFNEIKAQLKAYLKGQSEFSDYDFEGSSLSTLLDVLAYNSYYSAVNANLAINENFLDTAVLRENVVKLAKLIGYTPRMLEVPVRPLQWSYRRYMAQGLMVEDTQNQYKSIKGSLLRSQERVERTLCSPYPKI